jgi:hypothetical protein
MALDRFRLGGAATRDSGVVLGADWQRGSCGPPSNSIGRLVSDNTRLEEYFGPQIGRLARSASPLEVAVILAAVVGCLVGME